jgi:alpha-1,3-mannosyltransferase
MALCTGVIITVILLGITATFRNYGDSRTKFLEGLSPRVARALHIAAVIVKHEVDIHGAFDPVHAGMATLWRKWTHQPHTSQHCKLDTMVLDELYKLPASNYFIAANLKNNEELLPHFTQQLLTVASLLHGSVFVSIYESGSTDDTPRLLQELQAALDSQGVRHHIITSGEIARAPGEARIEFLAKARNAALEPLYSNRTDADRVLFLNDMFFCANDVLRLALARADLACALDFAAATRDGQPQFVDTWVMRDVQGEVPDINYPFLKHPDSADSIRRGDVTPVQCCWNGIVALNPAPFRAGLRFRAHQLGECSASECSLLCNDMHRLGFKDIVVDPSVRVAHNKGMFVRLHIEGHEPQYHAYNSTMHASYRAHQETFPRSDKVQCCPLRRGNDFINWGSPGCFPYNFTQERGSLLGVLGRKMHKSFKSRRSSSRAAKSMPR